MATLNKVILEWYGPVAAPHIRTKEDVWFNATDLCSWLRKEGMETSWETSDLGKLQVDEILDGMLPIEEDLVVSDDEGTWVHKYLLFSFIQYVDQSTAACLSSNHMYAILERARDVF